MNLLNTYKCVTSLFPSFSYLSPILLNIGHSNCYNYIMMPKVQNGISSQLFINLHTFLFYLFARVPIVDHYLHHLTCNCCIPSQNQRTSLHIRFDFGSRLYKLAYFHLGNKLFFGDLSSGRKDCL